MSETEKLRQITLELAYRIRFERGLFLPFPGNYADDRLVEIAERQHLLMQEFEILDEQIKRLYQGGQE